MDAEIRGTMDVVSSVVRADGVLKRRSLFVARAASRTRADLPLVILDALLAIASYSGALTLRFLDGDDPSPYLDQFGTFLLAAMVVHVASNWTWGLYGQIWRHASVAEARRVLLAAATSTLILASVVVGSGLGSPAERQRLLPLSVVLLGGAGAMVLLGGVRFQYRLFALHRRDTGGGTRVVIVGAGKSGGAVIRDMLRSPESGLVPVAVVDDDVRTHGRALAGVPVVAGSNQLSEVIKTYGSDQVLLAVPSAGPELVRRVADQARATDVGLKVLPSARELLGSEVSVQYVRNIEIDDFLGRDQVETDLGSVRQLLNGRTVLITGAGGSIGSEIARQVATCDPAKLVLLDHDETHLHDAAAALDVSAVQVLADIRDARLVDEVFRRHRPAVVFHAAAHKHVVILEEHPSEAVKTNVLGTNNLVRSARSAGVERFVLISTDKAVQPSSVMGASKRLAEQIVTAESRRPHVLGGGRPNGAASVGAGGVRCCAVRFGNVLGSRGSVVPTFARQIADGGPVTVRDPSMTRFFMSVREAVQLVLQAAALAEGGEVFMLDMGQPVNILDLATRMIQLAGRSNDIAIRITGMRPGEKVNEELLAPGEEHHPTSHPSITRLSPPPVDARQLELKVRELVDLADGDPEMIRQRLFAEPGAPDVIDLIRLEARVERLHGPGPSRRVVV